jgi:ribosomal protein L37E
MANAARQEYWGVSCRSCGKVIAFAKVKHEATSGERINPDPKPNPFSKDCAHCGFPSLYSAHELTPFDGPAALNFVPHEAFPESYLGTGQREASD